MRFFSQSIPRSAGDPSTNVWRPMAGRGSRAGMTLVEIMMALTVAGTACLSAVAGLLMALRTADSNLLALQAASAARSVGEQLQTIDYDSLFGSSLPVDVPGSATGSLAVNAWNSRTDDFRRTPANSNDDLRYRLRPVITRITETNGVDYAQVVIQFEWTDTSFFAQRTRTDTFTTLVASVSTY